MVLKVVSSGTGGGGGGNGTVTQVQGNGTVNGITLTGNVTTSGNLTLGGTLGSIANSQLSNSSATIGNTVVTLGSTVASIGNLTLANVTITSGTIPAANVTGLGTMAVQNANAVAITGGNTSVTYDNAVYQIATANIATSSNVGAFSYGNLSYSDLGVVASFANNANNSVQLILQNQSGASNASTDIVITNNTSTAYVDIGIASPTYSAGSGGLNTSNVCYVYSGSTDLYVGTSTNNAVHFLANNGSTDAMVVNGNNTVTINAYAGTTNANATFNTSSLPLVPLGYLVLNINGTNYKIPYYNV
jgi:hypothetical protein